MRRVLMGVAGVLWFALVFFVTWRLTFPSEAAGERLRVEVARATGGQYQLSLSDVKPWWTGIQANNVMLSEVNRGEATLVAAFESARVRAGLFSLLRNQPRISGAVAVGSSELDYDVTVGMNKRGTQLAPRLVNITADAFPLRDLAGLVGVTVDATGGLDIEIELEAGDGMRDAIGDIRIGGRDVLISSVDPEVTFGMDLGMEIPIDEIDIHFEVDQGKATVRTGKIRSSKLDTEIEGDITLREDVSRSSMDLTFILDLGDDLEIFKGFLKRAEWGDGTFHYKCSGSFSRPVCREDPERGGSAARSGRRNNNRGSRATRPTTNNTRNALTPEEREKRRQEALERLRASRERRASTGSGSTAADGGDDPGEELEEIGYAEDEEFIDEELPPDDLPPDDVPLDDEVILDGEEPLYDER